MEKTVLITGGHVTPALAVIDVIQQTHPQWHIVYVGRKIAIEGSSHVSPEQALVEKLRVSFYALTAGRLTRTLTLQSLFSWMKMPVGFVQAFFYCLKVRPDVVVSFGGYIALPIAVSASLLGIPVITHEQTLAPGLANRIISRFARRICVTFPESKEQFPSHKTVVTGLPVRKEFFASSRKRPNGVANTKDIIYITGGSTGAASLNDIVFGCLKQLLADHTLIHQTGKMSYAQALRMGETLPEPLKSRYVVSEYYLGDDVAWIMRNAVLVVGRSGANTVMELALLGKRAILIPLPWSAGGEQLKNANWLKDIGDAIILPQETLTSELLGQTVMDMLRKKPKENLQSVEIPKDGAARVAKEIAAILS